MNIGDGKITILLDDKTKDGLKNLESNFNKAGKRMMLIGGAIVGMFAGVAKGAADFDMGMREVNTMINLSADEFEALKDQVMETSSEVGKSSDELAGALYQIVSAGVPAAEAIEFLGIASKLAVAGVTDVETAADGLTTVLNAFKLPAEDATRVADILFTTARLGKTTIGELSDAIFQVAPIASSAGIKFEEVAAAIATMSKQGIPTSVATRQLRMAIASIIKPTDEMARAIENAGYESGQAMLEEVGLSGALNMVEAAADGSQEKMAKMVGSTESLGATLALTGENGKTFAEDIATTSGEAAGAVETAYDLMNEGIGRRFEILFNDIKLMGDELGDAVLPVFEELLENLKPIVEKITEWIKENPTLIEQFLKIATILLAAGGVIFALSKVLLVIRAIVIAMTILNALASPAKLLLGLAAAAGGVALVKYLMPDTEEYVPIETPVIELPEAVNASAMQSSTNAVSGLQGATSNNINVEVGTFVGNESAFQEFARTIESAIGQNSRRTSFGTVNDTYFGGTSGP